MGLCKLWGQSTLLFKTLLLVNNVLFTFSLYFCSNTSYRMKVSQYVYTVQLYIKYFTASVRVYL
jgi:hypothetical protein